MRKLHGIAEIHDKGTDLSRLGKKYLPILSKLDLAREDVVKNFYKNLIDAVNYDRKVADVKSLLGELRPKVMFVEGFGKDYKVFLKEVGYRGKVVHLDNGYKPVEDMAEKMDSYKVSLDTLAKRIRKNKKKLDRLNDIDEIAKGAPNVVKRILRPVYNSTLGKTRKYASHINKRNNLAFYILGQQIVDDAREFIKMDHTEREKYWLDLIEGNIEEPAAILTGKAHQIKILENQGKLPEFLREKDIALVVDYEEH